ncbi:MAG: DEAD/DEAH box helicase [Planctomycetota bacterium]|jgi:ATP-dependent RNA helicase DeaD
MSNEEGAPETLAFKELPDALREACERAGWSALMPVQEQAIPLLLKGRDLMVQSRTGSGKTGAFILPILDRIDAAAKTCRALILVPTRELARQVAQEAEMLGGEAGLRVAAVYGGVGYGAQLDAFRKGAPLVVGTPGRILDHLMRKSLVLDDLEVLIFDEADRMLSMGFLPDMRRIRAFLPKRRVHGAMFSATYPPYVVQLSEQFLHEPEMLSLSADHVHVLETEHVYYLVDAVKKDRALIRIIEVENPASAIIFCNRKTKVDYVASLLGSFGYDADALSADLRQKDRERVMGRVREGKLKFLVATDVAARGIDIPDLSHVIQFEPPEDPESYIHRAGRTGRAGASGEAITLVSGVEEMSLKSIAKQFKFEIEQRPLPTDEEVEGIVSQRVTALLEARARTLRALARERVQRFVPLARSLGEDEDESILIAMLLDDYYQQSLHAPLAPPEEEPPRQRQPQRDRDRDGDRGRGRGAGGGRRRRR